MIPFRMTVCEPWGCKVVDSSDPVVAAGMPLVYHWAGWGNLRCNKWANIGGSFTIPVRCLKEYRPVNHEIYRIATRSNFVVYTLPVQTI